MSGRACTSLVPCLFLLLAACATIGPPQPPSLELPKPPADLRATRKGDKVTLTWTTPTLTTDRQTIRSLGQTRICRGLDSVLSQCGASVGEAPPAKSVPINKSPGQKIGATYGDVLPSGLAAHDPVAQVTYAVEVLNVGGRSAGLSNQVKVPLAETLPAPQDFAARVSDQGVVLTWTGQLLSSTYPEPVRYFYRVYCRPEGSQQTVLVGQIQVGGDAHPSIADQNFEWEKTYYYHATTLTVIVQPGKAEIQVEGDDSPEVKVFADDVFPPAVPSELQAVFSGPGQQPFIDLIWTPVTDVDLAGYYVYRREAGGSPVKLNTEPLKTPAYRDANVASGKNYAYSVSAVDLRGNESARSEEATEAAP